MIIITQVREKSETTECNPKKSTLFFAITYWV